MNRPNRFVVESNIPPADARYDVRSGAVLTRKQKREIEDVTAWMELQEEAEIEFLLAEIAGSNRRDFRRGYNA